jgi:L-lactate utilization protein LutB
MNEIQAWHHDALGAKTVKALIRNNFKAYYVKTGKEAVAQALDLIPEKTSDGIGGSWTISSELALPDILEKRGNVIFNHGKPGLTPEETIAIRKQQLTCDTFLVSSNAVTLDGKLVNVDGVGNRVAAMIFGPKRVIVIAGINKIVRDVAEAERRIELYAAPQNNKRLKQPNPCVQSGICLDCQEASRICNVTTIIRKCPPLTDIHVIIVGENLGF